MSVGYVSIYTRPEMCLREHRRFFFLPIFDDFVYRFSFSFLPVPQAMALGEDKQKSLNQELKTLITRPNINVWLSVNIPNTYRIGQMVYSPEQRDRRYRFLTR